MEIAIAADHGGFQLKEKIRTHLYESGYAVKDFGCYSAETVDFPEYAAKVGYFVSEHGSLGVLCCGTGIGMSIAANKIDGVRAAVVSDTFSAMMTRRHNDSNVLCLGERVLGDSLALLLLDTWLEAEFEGGRHLTRLAKLTALETGGTK
ncbi:MULTISPECIES: ribose 5-phosphate isomerase B [Listeria]|uniref:Ribose 5-phosphate isomerase n=3 Tax=Listeria TaxID=1637 RepID=A0A7X0X1V0_LISSE|nr:MULTISPECIES: ribose 5-phosphate isomerase B [Listeria]EFS04274.1 ribose 5-phosphate isomerase B [Listeria seeligeri FSL S4-171]AHI55002.1 ribose 5-phosphate isomerase [Listeria ivanovii WSLC3009]AIS64458.1 ribose 5-phosphate isomerase [Listeria ivanovii subsp. ivanovii]EFS01212.1 ribose 5-phosphate isomerase B [Listeria seeligeri FSL N1-067]KKD44986.1 ribose 5-phosphate isomerase [Listeria seeligeri]